MSRNIERSVRADAARSHQVHFRQQYAAAQNALEKRIESQRQPCCVIPAGNEAPDFRQESHHLFSLFQRQLLGAATVRQEQDLAVLQQNAQPRLKPAGIRNCKARVLGASIDCGNQQCFPDAVLIRQVQQQQISQALNGAVGKGHIVPQQGGKPRRQVQHLQAAFAEVIQPTALQPGYSQDLIRNGDRLQQSKASVQDLHRAAVKEPHAVASRLQHRVSLPRAAGGQACAGQARQFPVSGKEHVLPHGPYAAEAGGLCGKDLHHAAGLGLQAVTRGVERIGRSGLRGWGRLCGTSGKQQREQQGKKFHSHCLLARV